MTPTAPTESVPRGDVPLDRTVDLLVSLLLAGLGVFGSLLGLGSYWFASEDLSRRIVTEMPVHSSFLTDAELVAAVHQFMVWGGLGLAVAGLVVSATGAAFLIHRTRLRRRVDEPRTDLVTGVVVGAAATGFASVLPFGAAVGGGVAGYLCAGKSGVATGALAGLVAAVPVVVFLGGLAVGAGAAGLPLFAGGLAVAAFVAVLYFCGLSALGGFVGERLAARA